MGTIHKVTRRSFLQTSAGAGAAGLILSFQPEALAAFSAADTGKTAFAPNVFVEIVPTGKVRLIAHRQEMGQGVRTSMPMLLAEELEVPWQDVEVVQAVADKKYGDQNTDGSTSVRVNWERLRQAGAAAREMLVEAAARRWGVPAADCRAEDGAVHHAASGRSAGYGELAADAAKLEVPAQPRLKQPSEWKILGKRRGLVDVPNITRGQATYGIDVQLPGMLFASVEHSPTVSGKPAKVDSSKALLVRGVRKVIELPALPMDYRTLAGVAVVADNTWSAFEGRDALAIEWDRGSASESSEPMAAALQKLVDGNGQPIRKEGDYAAARSAAAKVLEARFHGPYLVHAPMEPMAATVLVKEGSAEVWAPTQDPQTVRQRVAKLVGVPEDDVTVNVTLLGGGFGRKSKPDFILEAAQIAKQMPGTPIKLTWKREDEVRCGYYRAQNCQKLEATLDADGKLTGWRQHSAFPTILSTFMPGATNPAPFELGMGMTNMPYRVPNVQLESSGIASDVRIGWLRSVCNTFHAHASNCFVDEIAEAVGKDPVALRLELLGEPRQLSFSDHDQPYGMDTGRLSQVIREAAKMAKWGEELPDGVGHGFAAHFSFLTYVAMALQASVSEGKARVHQVDCVVDCGTVVNPDTVLAQVEGAVVFALSYALYGEITLENGAVKQSNFHDYPLLRTDEMPKINIQVMSSDKPPSGIGEPGVPPVSAALANALYRVTGKRLRDLPIAKQLA